MHLELEELQKQIDGARKYAATDGAAAGLDGNVCVWGGGRLSWGGWSGQEQINYAFAVQPFLPRKQKEKKRKACLVFLCGRPPPPLPPRHLPGLWNHLWPKKKKSQHDGDCDANLLPWFWAATMHLLLSGAFKQSLLEEPTEEQLPVHVIRWFIYFKKKKKRKKSNN